MQTNDLKFFTNEPERDLYGRFNTILRSSTQFFDALVGYFRTSGFFKLYPAMESVEKIRILVGIDVNRFTVKIIDQAKEEIKYTSISSHEGKNLFSEKVEHEFESVDTTEEIERGVRTFIDWIKSGKLEMRLYTDAPIHAKVYIMRKDPEIVPDTFGSVITGSSNFSEAGLLNNLEFNVELKDRCDVEFALDRFEKLWEKSEDIKDVYVEAVQQRTWMRDDITPYQLYLKTLYEYFKEEINEDKENFDTLLPDGFMKLLYQRDAVLQARKKLDAYNGVFISDVVGLGKTYICAMLANSLPRNSYKLIVCPPVLVDYWREVLQEFDVSRFDVISLGKLDRIINKSADKYDYVFVDEAHRFRNSDTESFTQLHQICRGKKVVLISATPINNYTSDIENQIYLFQSKKNGTKKRKKKNEGFFAALNGKLKKLKKGTPAFNEQLRENSEIIRDRLLREIMIRRTRTEIEEYYKDDLEKQGLSFPKAGSPEKILYEFDDETDNAFSETMSIIKDFGYARYMPLAYLKDQKKYASMIIGQKNMGGFMKGILIKRLESSFHAFRMTLQRFIDSYEQFISMFMSGTVYISKTVNVYDLLDNGQIEKLMDHIEKEDVMQFESKEFKPEFIRALNSDLSDLKTLQGIWSFIDDDPKLVKFKEELTTNPIIKGNKVIVFTESTETAEYLYKELEDVYGERIIYFSGQSSLALKEQIEDSFNPKNKNKNNDKYDLLITTDVLAEGINLHRSNIIINYDLPWNPTRIMQRVGRINRVGTEHERIFVFNFFPTAQSHNQMPMEDRILEKLQQFHDTLGEDSKFLSDEEVVSPKKLFSDLTQDIDAEEDGTAPELKYLAVIRKVRDEDVDLFLKIRKLPKKAKAGKRIDENVKNSTISFIRKGALKTFFYGDEDGSKQLTFMEAIKYIESSPDDKATRIGSDYYRHFVANDNAFEEMLLEEEVVTTEKATLLGNDAKVVKLLKALKSDERLTDDQEEKLDILITRWQNGEMPARISKEIMKKSRTMSDVLEFYYDVINMIPDTYFEEKRENLKEVSKDKQVILSCYMRAGGK